jgi:hypothetical protein
MSDLLRISNGNMAILARFGNLSPSKLTTRSQLAKKEEKLINMGKHSWTEMKLMFSRSYTIYMCSGQISLIDII